MIRIIYAMIGSDQIEDYQCYIHINRLSERLKSCQCGRMWIEDHVRRKLLIDRQWLSCAMSRYQYDYLLVYESDDA